ncbi:MAG: undecaprenyl-diphosphate phosphatase [Nitrospinota bacterium]
MKNLTALLLGVMQGVAEFLPISSSGHLVIAQHFIKGFKQPGILFDVVLHVGTLVSTLIYFRRDIVEIIKEFFKGGRDNKKTAILIIVASLPTAIIGLTFKDYVETVFSSVSIAAAMLLVTGLILFLTGFVTRGHKDRLGFLDAILIGTAQGIAIMPGISRSGVTISTGIFRKIDAEEAGRFSFLLSIPAILGALLIESRHISLVESGSASFYIVGAVAAMVAGLLSIHFLMSVLRSKRLAYFAVYCWIIGGITFLVI